MPKVSVVMVTHNPGRFFGRALESILEQSFRDFELLAIDSASDDGTREQLARAAERDPRVRIIDLPARCGISIPRNIGKSTAMGELIAIMDGDDEMRPTRLERQVEYLAAHPDVHIIGSNFMLCEAEKEDLRQQPEADGAIKAKLLFANGSALHDPTTMIRADFLREHKLSRPYELTDADHGLWVAALKAGARFANVPEDLLLYNRHKRNVTKLNQASLEAGKTPIRRNLLLAFFPDLTGYEAEALALVMEMGRSLTIQELFAGLAAIEKISRIAGIEFGADRRLVNAILKTLYEQTRERLKTLVSSA